MVAALSLLGLACPRQLRRSCFGGQGSLQAARDSCPDRSGIEKRRSPGRG
jgi:hypothetical protein